MWQLNRRHSKQKKVLTVFTYRAQGHTLCYVVCVAGLHCGDGEHAVTQKLLTSSCREHSHGAHCRIEFPCMPAARIKAEQEELQRQEQERVRRAEVEAQELQREAERLTREKCALAFGPVQPCWALSSSTHFACNGTPWRRCDCCVLVHEHDIALSGSCLPKPCRTCVLVLLSQALVLASGPRSSHIWASVIMCNKHL